MVRTLTALVSFGLLSVVLACSSPAPSEIARDEQAPLSAQLSTSPASVEVGNKVGNRVHDFSIRLTDGRTVSSASLVGAKQPAFLYFFATWCTTCRAELAQMRDFYPDYAEQVAFYLEGVDPKESLDQLEETEGFRGVREDRD